MNGDHTDCDKPGSRIGRTFLLVEWLAASVLILVMLLIGWFLTVSYWPDVLRLASERIEVILILTLLTAALLLVSVVALRHTRD